MTARKGSRSKRTGSSGRVTPKGTKPAGDAAAAARSAKAKADTATGHADTPAPSKHHGRAFAPPAGKSLPGRRGGR
jgi:hypothetical protein